MHRLSRSRPVSRPMSGWRFAAIALLSLLALTHAASAQDGLPTGSISFFSTAACPSGWAPHLAADGRLLVPVIAGFSIGAQVGPSIAYSAREQPDPIHRHTFSASIDVADTSYVLAGGCCNKDLGSDGGRSFSGTSDFANTGLPYVMLLVCRKQATPSPTAAAPPKGTLMHFDSILCPTGWSPSLTTQGRFLVGLPASGQAGATFGGSALDDKEDRQHRHSFSGSVSTASQGIIGASGCCADGYAKNGSYDYSGNTGTASSGWPYIQLLACEKD